MADEVKTRTVKVDGKDIEIPESKIDKMLAFALQMEGADQELTEFRNLKNYLETNPKADEAVRLALADPNAVLSRRTQTNQNDEQEDDDLDMSDMDDREKALMKKIRSLETRLSKLDEIEGTLNETREQSRAQTIQSRIEAALAEYGLKGSSAQMLKDQVATFMHHNPREPLAAVVAAQVGLFKKAMKEHQKGSLDLADEKGDLETQRADSGTETVTETKKMTGEDLRTGKILQAALQHAKGIVPNMKGVPGMGLPSKAD